jgi:hypothetical protein
MIFSLCEMNQMADAFQTFAKDVVQLLGSLSYTGSQFAVEIFNFEKRIAEITPDPRDLLDPVIHSHRITVSDLKSMSNTVSCFNCFFLCKLYCTGYVVLMCGTKSLQIFWEDFLKFLFPQGNINDQTEILTPSLEYLTDISSIISATDKG